MSQNSRNQGFSYYICLMIEGSESIPLTDGSGSGWPKNTWIRIRNSGKVFSYTVVGTIHCSFLLCFEIYLMRQSLYRRGPSSGPGE
jgi:hypothetical protein